ncbi:MAG: transposase [Deltaproteobacteria bacterium]|nr:transposase [Nannocystaceae bacterium]
MSSSTDDLRAKIESGLASGDMASVLALFESMALRQSALEEKQSELEEKQNELEAKLARRDLLIARMQRVIFGRSSEKLSAPDLRQLVMLYGATEADAAVPDPLLVAGEPAPTEPEEIDRESGSRKKKRGHPGRTKLSPDLERLVTDVQVPEPERACTHCGVEMSALAPREHERVEYVPAKFVVHVERREVLVCKTPGCRHDATTAERATAQVLEPRVGASVLAHLIESKCDDALPIHRQCDQFARLGFDVPVNTLYGYWAYATNLLEPVADAVFGTVLDDPAYVGLDDTGLDVLDKTREAGKLRGHLWCFRGTTPLVAYRFTKTWQADEIEPWIRAIPPNVFIQVDDYAGSRRPRSPAPPSSGTTSRRDATSSGRARQRTRSPEIRSHATASPTSRVAELPSRPSPRITLPARPGSQAQPRRSARGLRRKAAPRSERAVQVHQRASEEVPVARRAGRIGRHQEEGARRQVPQRLQGMATGERARAGTGPRLPRRRTRQGHSVRRLRHRRQQRVGLGRHRPRHAIAAENDEPRLFAAPITVAGGGAARGEREPSERSTLHATSASRPLIDEAGEHTLHPRRRTYVCV